MVSQQVMDVEGWMKKMNLPWRDHEGGLTFDEVDEYHRRIDIPALRGYSDAVHGRSQEIMGQVGEIDLDLIWPKEHVRKFIVDKGLGHSNQPELVEHYSGWSREK